MKSGKKDLCFESVTLAAAICPGRVFKRAEKILLYFYYMSNSRFVDLSPPPHPLTGDKVLTLIVPQCGECDACLHVQGNFCDKQELVDLFLAFYPIAHIVLCPMVTSSLFLTPNVCACSWVSVSITVGQYSPVFRGDDRRDL